MNNDFNIQDTESVTGRRKWNIIPGGKKVKWIVLAAVCCIAVIVIITAGSGAEKRGMRAADTLESKTAEVERRTLVESVSATGKVVSAESKTVTASVTGVEIKSVKVKAGDMVSEGDVLCVLDSSALEQNLSDARTSLNAAQGKSQISLSSAQRELEEAQTDRSIGQERADADVEKAWNSYQEAVNDQEEAESEHEDAKDAAEEKKEELERVQRQLEEAQKKMDDASGSEGKSGEYASGFDNELHSLEEYAQTNNLTLKSDGIHLNADLSSVSVDSMIEAKDAEGQEAISGTVNAELANYLDRLKEWQNKYQEAAAADSAYQNAKAEYEKLQQEAASRQQEYSAARQSETESKSNYENAVNEAESRQETYDQKVRSKEDTIRSNDSTVNSKNDSLQNSAKDAAVSGMSDKQKIREYEKQIEACTVKAPISGVITEVSAEEGKSYSGETIVVIEDNSAYQVTAEIDEYDIGKVRVGQKAVIKTNGTGDMELEGEVKKIAPRATTSESGSDVTYKVDISIDTPCDELKIDMTAKLNIVLNRAENVLAVPGDALQDDGNGSYYIEILKNDTAESAEESVQQEPEKEGDSDGMKAREGMQEQMPQTEKITVQKGMESDYYVEVISDRIGEGMKVILPASDDQDLQDMMQRMGPMGGF